jgi:hypothetical protein
MATRRKKFLNKDKFSDNVTPILCTMVNKTPDNL